jgi:RimJ/RimL family protein N-acetyltransferase
MELIPGTEDDVWLTVALETDAGVMAELGGPWSVEQAQAAHRRRIASIATDGTWWLMIVPGPGQRPVGTIGVWHSEVNGEACSETGWMILPEHQRKGYATAALATLLELARADPQWGDIHAFPGATNVPSNALCRKFGFEELESLDVEYSGRPLHVNHWIWRAPSRSPG